MFLKIELSFTNLLSWVLAVFCQTLNYIKIISNMYIVICIRFDYFVYTYKDFYYLASILANIDSLLVLDLHYLINTLKNINNMLKVNFCHLANTLINTNNILKLVFYYLVNILTNTNKKTDNFINEKSVISNQLLTFYY